MAEIGENMDLKTQDPVEMAIGAENGKVFVHFQKAIDHIEFEPGNALDVCAEITRLAMLADKGLNVQYAAHKMDKIDQHRRLLTNRFATVLNSLRENKKWNHRKLAQELVDICLREVF